MWAIGEEDQQILMCEPQKSGSLDMFLRQVSLTISFETVYWFTPSDIQNWFYVGLAGLSAGGRILTRGCCSSSVTLCPGNLTKNMIVSAANKFWTKWDYIMGKLDRIHGLHKQYRESLEIHVCGIVCHICGNFDRLMCFFKNWPYFITDW